MLPAKVAAHFLTGHYHCTSHVGAPANVPAGSRYPVRLDVKYDYDLFDEQLAHDFKVKPVETEFIRLEETMRRVAAELSSMVHNEVLIRTVNGIATGVLLSFR